MLKNCKTELINIAISFVLFIYGIILFSNPAFGLDDICMYIGLYFLSLTFISFVGYFINRTQDNQNNLVNSVLYLLISALLLYSKGTDYKVLALSVLAFTLTFSSYKLLEIYKSIKNNNYKYVIKGITLLMFIIISALTVYNLYNSVSVQTLMFGFYFLILSILTFVENAIYVFIKSSYFKVLYKRIKKEEVSQSVKDFLRIK